MQKFFLIVLLLLNITCKERSHTLIPLQETQTSSWSAQFLFGEWDTVDSRSFLQNFQQKDSWGYFFSKTAQGYCLYSHSPWFFEKEKGPKFSLCFSEEEGERLAEFLEENKNPTQIFQVLELKSDERNFKIYFLNQNEVSKELELSQSFLLGEKSLCEEASKFHSFLEKNQYCTSGRWKNIETSFSLPYFSILEQKENYIFLSPPSYFHFGKNRRYLVLQIEKSARIKKILDDFFLAISQKQNSFIERCKVGQIEFSEGMGISNSHTGKFLELYANNTEVLCFHEFQIQINSQAIPLKHPTGYLLPESYLLLIPEDSRLEGEPYPELDWKKIQKKQKLELIQNGFKEEWEPPLLGAVYDKEEFSSSKTVHSCEHKNTITLEKNFCGTPGSPNKQENFALNCGIENFELSEWNTQGIFVNDKLESTGNFIELSWKGSIDCKNEFYILQVGNSYHPFQTNFLDWKKSNLLVFGSEKFFQHVNLISRSLGNFRANNKIVIHEKNGTYKVLYEPQENESYVSQTFKGIYSLINSNSKPSFHSNSSFYLNEKNFMSPGKPNSYSTTLTNTELEQFYISEYNAKGSYTSSDSITEDKFIEIFTPFQTHVELVLNYSKGEFVYHFPSQSEYSVLSKEKLYCSSLENQIIDKNLLFPFEDVTWSLKVQNQTVYSKFFPKTENGFEDRKEKIRKSMVYTFPNLDWDYSLFSHPSLKPECQGYTFASPGHPNSFAPIFSKQSSTNWKIYFPKDFYLPTNLSIQSIFPSFTQNFSIYPNYPFINFELPNISDGNLFYLSLDVGKNYSIYQKEKFLIQAVLPNPENPQNEWVLLCNKSAKSFFIEELLIQDQTHSDTLVPWNTRFPSRFPTNNPNFNGIERELKTNQCAYVLDPDASFPYLFEEGELPVLVWTVRDSSIGNGIGNTEGIDVFQILETERVHLHSFRNFLFRRKWESAAEKGEIFYLKPNRLGVSLEDYEIRKEVLP